MTAIDSEEGPWREKVPHIAEQSEGDAEAEHDVYLHRVRLHEAEERG